MTFDLDAAVVETGEPMTFTYAGETFELPVLLGLPYADHAAFLAARREDERLRILFGPADYSRFVALGPTAGKVRALIDAWWDYQGVTEGESLASAGSSPSTEAPSKRTSNATTA